MSVAERRRLVRALTQSDFNRFAALSGDDNPIHVDPAYAARTRFGRTVSHRILLDSVLRGLAAELRPGAELVRNEIRFPAPTFAGEPMVFEVRAESGTVAFSCAREADGAVTCDGRFLFSSREAAAAERADEASQGKASSRSSVTRGTERPSRQEQLGDSAVTTRSFSAADVAEYAALGGEQPRDGLLPEPMISAVFSYLLGVHLPGPGANYLKQETDFIARARIGEGLVARVEVTRLRPEKSLVDLATLCTGEDGRTLASGRALIFVGARDGGAG